MLGNNQQRRQTKAFESIARSAGEIAGSMRTIAAAEREKTQWLRGFFEWWKDHPQATEEAVIRRYGSGGGMRGSTNPQPNLPNGPSGISALPEAASRPCINVTPPKAEKSRRKSLW